MPEYDSTGLLPFPYLSSTGNVEVEDVRVTKPNGSVVTTPKDDLQDLTPEIYRDAPMYSDLREKHLAALLKAVGIQAFPVLISSHTTVDTDVPSPGQFNHVISVVLNSLSWMDTTPEVAPIGYL